MIVGVNAGFGEPLARAEIDEMAQMGVSCRTEITPAHSDEQVAALLRPFADSPIQPLVILLVHQQPLAVTVVELVAHVQRVERIAADLGVVLDALEVANEPDLEDVTPAQAGDLALTVYQVAHAPVYAGSISNLTWQRLDYLAAMRWARFPADLRCAVHRYAPKNDPDKSHSASRQHEIQAVIDATGGRLPAVTEFGYHTAYVPNRWPWQCDKERYTPEECAAAIVRDLDEYAAFGLPRADVFQWRCGPGDSVADQWGIRTAAGTWREQAYAIQQRHDRKYYVRHEPKQRI